MSTESRESETSESAAVFVEKLVQDTTREDRVRILLSNGDSIGPVRVSSIVNTDIHTNIVWTQELAKRLQQAEDLRTAKEVAIAYLSIASHSETEVFRYLVRKREIAVDVAKDALQWLKDERYVDDESLARRLAQQSAARQKESRRQAEQKLVRRGVSVPTARQSLNDTKYDEFTAAMELGLKKYRDIERKAERQALKEELIQDSRSAAESAIEDWTDSSSAIYTESHDNMSARSRQSSSAPRGWHLQVAGYLSRKGFSSQTIKKVLQSLREPPTE